jgi:hypothetical protein
MIVTTVDDITETAIWKMSYLRQKGKRHHWGGPINSLDAVWSAWATYFTTQDDGIKWIRTEKLDIRPLMEKKGWKALSTSVTLFQA